jgi:antitoxin YefM
MGNNHQGEQQAMNEVTATHFRDHLHTEVDQIIANHEILRVRRQQGGAFVVMGEDDWRAIEETLYLNQTPGLVESLHRAAQEPLGDGVRLEDLDW